MENMNSKGKNGGPVIYWLNEIDAAKKREKDFRKDGERIIEIYSGCKKEEIPFNILYSNTETLMPALYSAIPKPVIQRRFKDDDPMAKFAADAGMRTLEFLIDTNVEGYENFNDAMQAAVLDALLPGRGITAVKYEADFEGEDDPTVKYETVCSEPKAWNRVYFGYAKRWSKMPWIAYEEQIDKDEAERLFGKEIAEKMVFTGSEEEKESKTSKSRNDDEGERKTALVYQIWDKDGGKKIRWISPAFKEKELRVDDDPLGITGFFNCPRPLQFLSKTTDTLPTALYLLYENQATELNRLTVRINRIVEALKARGVYDSSLGDEIENIMKVDDNTLVPADKSSSLAAEKGLDNAIWFMPVEKLVAVLEKLYLAREQCKRVIYEVTGISDIIRGSTVASETATAQNIKSQWGTLRLKRLQKEVHRYARDLLRIMLDVASSKFSESTFAKITGLPFATDEQKMQAQQLVYAAQLNRVQPDPQAIQILQSPAWADVMRILTDDYQRAYRVDIETNSTVEAEATDDKQGVAEVMNAMSQFLNGVSPLVRDGSMPFQTAQAMLLAVVRRYRFGPDIEDYIKQMQPPQQPGGEELQKAMQEVNRLTEENNTLKLQRELDRRELSLAKKEADLKFKEQAFNNAVDLNNANMREREAISRERDTAFTAKIDKRLSNIVKQNEKMTKKTIEETPLQPPKEIQEIMGIVSNMAQAINQLGETVQQLAMESYSPIEMERDHEGNIATIKKGGRTLSIVRDTNGKMIGMN